MHDRKRVLNDRKLFFHSVQRRRLHAPPAGAVQMLRQYYGMYDQAMSLCQKSLMNSTVGRDQAYRTNVNNNVKIFINKFRRNLSMKMTIAVAYSMIIVTRYI